MTNPLKKEETSSKISTITKTISTVPEMAKNTNNRMSSPTVKMKIWTMRRIRIGHPLIKVATRVGRPERSGRLSPNRNWSK